jgi:hypothetical protein
MRYGIFLASLFCANASLADVYTCQTRSGETVYSDVPCAKGSTIEKISPSESEPDPAAAQRELERQKAYVERQAAENAKAQGKSARRPRRRRRHPCRRQRPCSRQRRRMSVDFG